MLNIPSTQDIDIEFRCYLLILWVIGFLLSFWRKSDSQKHKAIHFINICIYLNCDGFHSFSQTALAIRKDEFGSFDRGTRCFGTTV